MHEDNILLIVCFLIWWITFAILAFKNNYRVKFILPNLLIHTAYSVFFLSMLVTNTEGGMGLVWWFYLMVAIGAHWLVNVIQWIKKK